MTDREKKDLKAEVSNAFDNFNVLENAATIGELKNDILRLIDSVQNGHKFKVGDWIISEEAHKDYRICKITGVEDGCYAIESIEGYKSFNNFKIFEAIYHTWTIKDAQPGDILANDHHILILRELGYTWASEGEPECLYAYCGIKPNGNFELEKKDYCFCGTLHTHPATKEEREQLFRKMTEAGYRWNANKRQLISVGEHPDDNNLDTAVVNYMSQFNGDNFYKAPWAIDSTGIAMPKALAQFGANWQKERDKKWLVVNHKQIFNNGYAEGFEAGSLTAAAKDVVAWFPKKIGNPRSGD